MFPRGDPGNIVTLISVPGIPELLGFEVNLVVCATEMRTNIYFISVLDEGHGLSNFSLKCCTDSVNVTPRVPEFDLLQRQSLG